MRKHLLSIKDLSEKEILEIVDLGIKLKKSPKKQMKTLSGKTLLMIFAKPSLRTHLSFEVAMHQLGGHPIFYNLGDSTLGKKESIKDFSKVISRYVDVVMARLYEHKDIEELAEHSDVPIINGLTNYYHPCQILGDFMTVKEHLGKLKGIKIAYLGDGNNNVVHDLIIGADKVGAKMVVSCPSGKNFMPNPEAIGNVKYIYEKNSAKAVEDADIVYTDSWMSYHIPANQEKAREKIFKPYQVNEKLFKISKKALFMHCLPAGRRHEVTDEVIDSKRSIVYDQAENRMWAEKAVLIKLVGK